MELLAMRNGRHSRYSNRTHCSGYKRAPAKIAHNYLLNFAGAL
jgi:hypothetical protein